jgi:hypothetical protein
VNFRPAIAAFTVWAEPEGFVLLCPLTPPTRPGMRFLFIDPWLCTPASFPRILAATQLPSASTFYYHGSMYRGLKPHEFTPMPGVHNAFEFAGGSVLGLGQGFLPRKFKAGDPH